MESSREFCGSGSRRLAIDEGRLGLREGEKLDLGLEESSLQF